MGLVSAIITGAVAGSALAALFYGPGIYMRLRAELRRSRDEEKR